MLFFVFACRHHEPCHVRNARSENQQEVGVTAEHHERATGTRIYDLHPCSCSCLRHYVRVAAGFEADVRAAGRAYSGRSATVVERLERRDSNGEAADEAERGLRTASENRLTKPQSQSRGSDRLCDLHCSDQDSHPEAAAVVAARQ